MRCVPADGLAGGERERDINRDKSGETETGKEAARTPAHSQGASSHVAALVKTGRREKEAEAKGVHHRHRHIHTKKQRAARQRHEAETETETQRHSGMR